MTGIVIGRSYRIVIRLRPLALLACLMLTMSCAPDDRDARRKAAGPGAGLDTLMTVASESAGATVFHQCAACHTINQGSPDLAGPNLHDIVGQPVGQHRPRFGYTVALQSVGGRWTRARLDRWLTSPQRFAPGTSMHFAGLADPLDRADVIAYLESRK